MRTKKWSHKLKWIFFTGVLIFWSALLLAESSGVTERVMGAWMGGGAQKGWITKKIDRVFLFKTGGILEVWDPEGKKIYQSGQWVLKDRRLTLKLKRTEEFEIIKLDEYSMMIWSEAKGLSMSFSRLKEFHPAIESKEKQEESK